MSLSTCIRLSCVCTVCVCCVYSFLCVYAVEVAAACSNAAEDDTGDGGQMHSSEAKPPLA